MSKDSSGTLDSKKPSPLQKVVDEILRGAVSEPPVPCVGTITVLRLQPTGVCFTTSVEDGHEDSQEVADILVCAMEILRENKELLHKKMQREGYDVIEHGKDNTENREDIANQIRDFVKESALDKLDYHALTSNVKAFEHFHPVGVKSYPSRSAAILHAVDVLVRAGHLKAINSGWEFGKNFMHQPEVAMDICLSAILKDGEIFSVNKIVG